MIIQKRKILSLWIKLFYGRMCDKKWVLKKMNFGKNAHYLASYSYVNYYYFFLRKLHPILVFNLPFKKIKSYFHFILSKIWYTTLYPTKHHPKLEPLTYFPEAQFILHQHNYTIVARWHYSHHNHLPAHLITTTHNSQPQFAKESSPLNMCRRRGISEIEKRR